MKKFLFACLILVTTVASAQQDPLHSNYRFNRFLLNPAVAGTAGQWVGRASYRSEWTRFPGSPVTATASFHGLLGNRVGAGVNILSDYIGITRTYGVQMAYSYNIPFDNFNLSLGLAGRAMNFNIDQSQAVLVQNPDPALFTQDDWLADLAFGAYIHGKKFWAGLSAPQLVQLSGEEAQALEPHIYAMGGYRFDVAGGKVGIEPMTFLRFVMAGGDGNQFAYDFNLRGYFLDEQLMAGVGYRDGNFLALMAGFNVQDRYQFSYSYDFAFGEQSIQPYSWGSHEVTLGFKFGRQKIDFLKKGGQVPAAAEDQTTEE